MKSFKKIGFVVMLLMIGLMFTDPVLAEIDKSGYRRSNNTTAGQVSCALTATAVFSTSDYLRTSLRITNNSGGSVWIDDVNTVSATNGLELITAQSVAIGSDVHPYSGTLYCIALTAPKTIPYIVTRW